MATDKEKLGIYLPPDLIKQLKTEAIKHGISASSIVEKAITAYLSVRYTTR